MPVTKISMFSSSDKILAPFSFSVQVTSFRFLTAHTSWTLALALSATIARYNGIVYVDPIPPETSRIRSKEPPVREGK